MKLKAEHWHYLMIFVMGLTPLLWFVPEHMIKQIDFDLPLTLERFRATFYSMWDYQNGAGLPRSLHMPAFLFFLPQALFGYMGFELEAIQRIFFCLWFMLPGFSFYYLMKVLLPQTEGGSHAGRLIAVSFYMFNLYLEPIWIGFNMANLSVYVGVPLALGILIRTFREESPVLISSFKVAIVFSLFPAMAINPSMLIIAAIPFFVLVFKYLIDSKWRLKSVFYFGKLFLLSLTLVLLFNAYWILPEVKNLFETNMVFTSADVTGGNISDDVFFVSDWVKGISQNTSLVNVIKMQGDWPWYQGFRKHAQFYWTNPFLIVAAWFPLALSLFALWRAKHPYKWFFGGILVVALILSTGAHPPFGKLFLFLMDHVPLFWTIRSPWYKFTFLTCLGYGVLIGLGSQIIFNALAKRKSSFMKGLSTAALVFFVAMSPSYAFPLVKGDIFRRPLPGEGYPNHFKVPYHVREAADWLNQQEEGGRVLDLPSRGIMYNEWGYEGFLPLIGYFLNRPIFCDNHPLHIPYQGAWGSSWIYFQKLIRNSFEKGLTPYVSNLLRLLGVKYILHEEDFKYPVLPFPTTVDEINSKIESMAGVKRVRSFGNKWSLWEVANPVAPLYAVSKISLVNGSIDSAIPLSVRMNESTPAYSFLNEVDPKTYDHLIQNQYVGEVISFEDSFSDWVVQSLSPEYLHRIPVKSSEAWMVAKKKEFLLKEGGDYLVFAKRSVPNKEVQLRLGVDFTPYPQSTEIEWNLNVFQKSIKQVKKTDFLPENPAVVVLKSVIALFGIQYQHLSFRVIKKSANVLLDKSKQGVSNRAVFYVDGKKKFLPDKEVSKLCKAYPSKKWKFLGGLSLNEGGHSFLAKSFLNRWSVWEFYIVPRQHFMEKVEQALSLYQNKEIGQSFLFCSTSTWDCETELEKKNFLISEEKALKIKEEIHNRTFGYTIFNHPYACTSAHYFKFEVVNSSEKTFSKTVSFNMISTQNKPKTLEILLNNKKIKEIIVDPMQEYTVLLKNLEIPPGLTRFDLRVYYDAIPLGTVLGNDEPREARFGIRNIQVGELHCEQSFHLPSAREFEVQLFPFLGKGQNKENWHKMEHLTQIRVDDQVIELKKNKEGEKGFYLSSQNTISLNKGPHVIRFSKELAPEYFVLLQSKASKKRDSLVLDFHREKPTKMEVTLMEESPQVLIFSESFDPKWRAFFKKSSEFISHFKINGYAHAFIIDKTKNKDLVIEYLPQRHFRFGLWVSLLSLLLFSLSLFALKRFQK